MLAKCGIVSAILIAAFSAVEGRTQSVEHVPHTPGAVGGLLLGLSSTDHRPYGFESVDEPENRALWNSEPVDPGTSIRAFMVAYARVDTRFEVRDIEGIPVMRPLTAWRDPNNPLHQRLGASLVVQDVGWRDVLGRLCHAAGSKVRVSQESPGHLFLDAETLQAHDEAQTRHVSLALGEVTVLRALNTLAQAHGELGWTLQYTRQGPVIGFSTTFHDTFGCYLPRQQS